VLLPFISEDDSIKYNKNAKMTACSKMAEIDVRPDMNTLRPTGGIVKRSPGERRTNKTTAAYIY
jgi:hypothetical protein